MAAELLGPVLEPRLSRWQAAKRKGTCRENIRTAFTFLGGAGLPARDDAIGDPEAIARAILGPLIRFLEQGPPAGVRRPGAHRHSG